MKILLRSFLMLLAPMLALTGCTMETEVGPVNPNAGEAQVTFRVELPTHSKPETRGTVGTVDENAVNNIYVLAFDQSGNFAYSKKVTSITEVSSTNKQAKTFKASLITSADASDKYTFVLLANVGGETVAQITALTKTTAKAAALNSLTYTSDTAPLTGIPMASVSTAPIQVTASTTISDIKLIRMTARLDVTTALANYRIAEVNLYDYNKRGKVVSNNISAANLATSIDLPAAPEKTKGPVVAANTGSNLKIFENRLYTYEASNTTNKPCLVVKLEYSADGSTNWKSHGYYKLPFRQSGTPVDIKRNTRYVFSISQVTGEGFPDKEDAYKSEPVGIDTEVLEWDDTDLSGIVVSGNYFLAVGPTEFDLWKEASGGQVKIASNLPLQSGVQWTATVYDNIGGTSSTNSSWLTLTNSTGGVVYTDATKQKSELNFTVAENGETAPREAWIHIKGGSVVFKVRVTQSHLPDPNAVTPPSYPTPPTKGVKAPENILAVNNLGQLNLDGQKYVNDPNYTAIHSNFIVYFKWGSTVAISGGDNGDEYDLGDIAWIPSGFTSTLTNDSTSIPYGDETNYPTSFPAQNNATGLGDPCKLAGKAGYAIGDYRMPTGDPYEKFLISANQMSNPYWQASDATYGPGMNDDKNGQYYPVAGVRGAGIGNLAATGINGGYWSSTVGNMINPNEARYLSISSTYINPHMEGYRPTGLPIRCVTDVVTPSLELSGVSASYLADGTTEHTFTVKSNVAWTASATTNPSAVKSFDATGTANTAGQTFKFKLNTATAAGSVVFTFTTADGSVTKTATVNYTVPGQGGGGTPPTGGVLAPKNILAVDGNGVLNLDGPERPNNYIVYFKYGSVIAMGAGDGSSNEIFDITDVAWVPKEYDYNALRTVIGSNTHSGAYKHIPYQSTGGIITNYKDGIGDPCKLAVKDGTIGLYRTPTGEPYEQYAYSDYNVTRVEPSHGYWQYSYQNYGAGVYDSVNQQYYPAAGQRVGYNDPDRDNGEFIYLGLQGTYWSHGRTAEGLPYSFYFTQWRHTPSTPYHNTQGMSVRCVPN